MYSPQPTLSANENHLANFGAYWTSGPNYSGLSKQSKQHVLINKDTNERYTLHPLADIARSSQLKNLKISTKYSKQLN